MGNAPVATRSSPGVALMWRAPRASSSGPRWYLPHSEATCSGVAPGRSPTSSALLLRVTLAFRYVYAPITEKPPPTSPEPCSSSPRLRTSPVCTSKRGLMVDGVRTLRLRRSNTAALSV
ncbi:hypothetical protein D3C71_1514440 [compost metagenome]